MAKDVNALCNEYRDNRRLIEELEEMNKAIKNQIVEVMDGAEKMTFGVNKVTHKFVTRANIDGKKLLEDMPEVYEKYNSPVSYYMFRIM